MKASYKRWLKVIFLSIISLIVIVLSAMYFVPKLFNDKINSLVRELVKTNVIGDVEFDRIDLTFFSKFPYLTATIEKPIVQGIVFDSLSTKALFQAEEVSLGIDVLGLIDGEISLNQVFIDHANVNVYVDSIGNANYTIFISDDTKEDTNDELVLKIDKFHINKSNIVYQDLSSNVHIIAKELDYLGKGDMNEAVFDLHSLASIGNLDFIFAGVPYIKDKPVTAKLDTSVDTKSLTFGFNRNNIKIKNLPVDFKGHFGFVEGGYDMLFDIKTQESSLSELLSILPPSYQGWLDSTTLEGTVSGSFLLKGEYNVSKSLQPDLDFSLKLDNGLIHYTKVAQALENISLDVSFAMKNFDFNTADLQLRNLSFLLDKKQTNLSLFTKGFDSPWLKTSVDTNVDLALLSKTLGIQQVAMKGDLHLKGVAEGYYAKGIGNKRTKTGFVRDTIITSIPKFDVTASVSNGYFKLANLPSSIDKVNVNLNVVAKDSLIRNVALNLKNIDLMALDNYLRGRVHLKNLHNFDMDAEIQANVDLENIKDFIPLNKFVLRGKFITNSTIKGTFEPRKKLFPIIHSDIQFNNGYIQAIALPQLPIEDIEIHTVIDSKRGSLKDLSVQILPINFKLGGEPFQIAGSFYNLSDLQYEIKSKGVLNIGDFYKLFKIDGLDVRGKVITSLFLKGLQSDAVNGNFDKLKNGGKFEIDNIVIASEYLPKELFIKKGVFKFYKEKVKFEKFEATYGQSTFEMDGYLTNVIGNILKGDTLKGNFNLVSNYINADEFMMNGPAVQSKSSSSKASSSQTVQVPKDLKISFDAKVNKIKYSDYTLENFTGNVGLNNGSLVLNKTAFDMIGTRVEMDGNYESINKKSASFNYNISASNFDIQRAYKEVPLFREMVSMAKDAYGIVSLDYSLQGKLDREMMPVLPSVKGKGTLSLDAIKFKGFKLLGAIAEKGDAKGMENGSIDGVVIHSSINNNVLTIERTKMKMAGFRPRFEGQVSLDGELNIGFRLGLPPLGLLGVPMRITGTMEDFKIKVGQYKASEVMGRDDGLDDLPDEDDQSEEDKAALKNINTEAIITKQE